MSKFGEVKARTEGREGGRDKIIIKTKIEGKRGKKKSEGRRRLQPRESEA